LESWLADFFFYVDETYTRSGSGEQVIRQARF